MSKEDETLILKALETGSYTRAPNAAQEKQKAEAAVRAVGDGANDIAMIEAAGLGMPTKPNPLLPLLRRFIFCIRI
jgi:phosphoserine phosphatase